jgi:hypothetical protein
MNTTAPWKPRSNLRRRRTLTGEQYNEKSARYIAKNLTVLHSIAKARERFPAVEFSDKAQVKPAPGGVYVEGWVWIADD